MDTLLTILGWMMAFSSALMAGVYSAFSSFIMRAFATLEPAAGIAAMNAINDTIVKTSFLPLFFGSTMVAAFLAGVGLWDWGAPGSAVAVITGTTYVIGMFVVTAFANVPLNNQLARVVDGDAGARQIWSHYLSRWTHWNTLRTVASLATLAGSILLLQY